MKLILFAIAILSSTGSFAGRIDIAASDNKLTKPGVVSMWADWLKDKGKKYDIGFNIKNEHDKGIIILLGEMHCFRGQQEGVLHHTFFNTGERTIDLKIGQLKTFKFVCAMKDVAEGDFRVTVSNVYDNPSSDGKTVGPSLAKDLEWKVRVAN